MICRAVRGPTIGLLAASDGNCVSGTKVCESPAKGAWAASELQEGRGIEQAKGRPVLRTERPVLRLFGRSPGSLGVYLDRNGGVSTPSRLTMGAADLPTGH